MGVISAIVVLGASPAAAPAADAETALYLGTVSGTGRVEGDDGPPCGMDLHVRFSYSASLASFQGERDPFAIVSGSGSNIEGQGAKGYAETGSGTYVLDPCDEIQSPGCSTGLQNRNDGSYGQVLFDVEGQTVKATALPFGFGPTSDACGGVGAGGATPIGSGSFPLSMVGAQTITVPLTYHSSNGIDTWDGSGTLTLHRVGGKLSVEELGPASIIVRDSARFRARVFPPWATASRWVWQMRRSHSSHWTTIGTTSTNTLPWVFRLAGHFQWRVIAYNLRAVGFQTEPIHYGRTESLRVNFPTRDQIVNDQGVQSIAVDAWSLTLSYARELAPRRRELGFWITLNTCRGRYDHTRPILGRVVGPREDGEVPLGSRPADNPRHPPEDPRDCATSYTVASFHTHTPTTHREPPGGSRVVGPSRQDETNARNRKLPGLVFDYAANPPGTNRIPYGYAPEEPAFLYRYGPLQRPTPR